MKVRTLNNLLEIALLIVLIAALVMILWNSGHLFALPATVSWNGDIAY